MSPDATALALSNVDGTVRFYILENLDEMKLAHSWQPHAGHTVDALVFLDNLQGKPEYVVVCL